MNNFFKSKMPLILTCLSGVGLIWTTIETAKASSKAKDILNDAEEVKGGELTVKEKILETSPVYIKPAIIGASTFMCVVGIYLLDKKQQASISSAYALLENQYRKYREHIIKEYGKEKDDEIIEDIVAEQTPDDYKIYAPSYFEYASLNLDKYNGPHLLFYESNGNKWFESTMEQVISAEYHLNRNMSISGIVGLIDFYELLGLEDISDINCELGWCVNDEMNWIDFSHKAMKLKDGTEYCCIDTLWGASTDWEEYYE